MHQAAQNLFAYSLDLEELVGLILLQEELQQSVVHHLPSNVRVLARQKLADGEVDVVHDLVILQQEHILHRLNKSKS